MDKRKVAECLQTKLDRYILIGYRQSEIADDAAQLDALRCDMNEEIGELEDFGIKVRDLLNGIVDFPAERFGEKALLCWKYGESEVSFWHSPTGCYEGRKALKIQLIQP